MPGWWVRLGGTAAMTEADQATAAASAEEAFDLRPLRIGSDDFAARLNHLRDRAEVSLDDEVMASAKEIVISIRTGGDAALVDAVERYDGFNAASAGDLRVDIKATADSKAPGNAVDTAFRDAVDRSIDAVRRFHEPQRRWIDRGSYSVEDSGLEIEERVFALDRVGLYVPGGRFVYPSSVIMTVVPAQLAGVNEIVVASPPEALARSVELHYVLEALGIREVWGMGGAHTIAALAYGTESVKPVEFVAGPGNAWVDRGQAAGSGKDWNRP